MRVEIAADRFFVTARAQCGFGANSLGRQAHPREDGRLRVKRAQERLRLFHEESQGELFGSWATMTIVPFLQAGQRLRSIPVILSNKSLADSLGLCGKAGFVPSSLRH